MNDTPTTPVDASPAQPSTTPPMPESTPDRANGGGAETPPTGGGETNANEAPSSEATAERNNDGKPSGKAELPPLSHAEAVQYATLKTCHQLGRPLPPGFTPKKSVLERFEAEKAADDAAKKPVEESKGGGPAPSSEAKAPVPRSDDPLVALRSTYATTDPAKVDELIGADHYLQYNAKILPATLVDMPPESRVQLAVALRKRDGDVARLAGRASPGNKNGPKSTPPDGKALPGTKADQTPQPKTDDVLSDAPDDVREALKLLDPAETEALAKFIQAKTAPPPKSEPEPETEDQPIFDEREQRIVRETVRLVETTAEREFPWLAQPGGKEQVAAKVKAVAEQLGQWPQVLMDYDLLNRIYTDAATAVFGKELKASKVATAKASAITAAPVRPPSQAVRSGPPRELSRTERVAIAARAAREANGDPDLNARLHKQYIEEAQRS